MSDRERAPDWADEKAAELLLCRYHGHTVDCGCVSPMSGDRPAIAALLRKVAEEERKLIRQEIEDFHADLSRRGPVWIAAKAVVGTILKSDSFRLNRKGGGE